MGVADFLGDKSSLFIQVKAVYTQNKKQKEKRCCTCIIVNAYFSHTLFEELSLKIVKKEWHFVKTDINNMELYNNSGCYTHFYPLIAFILEASIKMIRIT